MGKRGSAKIRRVPVWIRVPVYLFVGIHVFFALCLVGLKFVDPFTTGVQAQRRVESWFSEAKYQKKQTWMPLERISPNLQHAVIAAEDGRFYQTYGIDWQQVEIVVQESIEEGEITRGASTITQQLVKNLFFTTHANPLRKVMEYSLAPMASVILGKRRVLELYLNIVEWGPGVWGAEAGSKFHWGTSAARLSRDQAARMAACLPSPRRRRAVAMNRYSAIIEGRMSLLGW